MKEMKLDDDIIELLKAKLDKRGDELYMLDTKVINLKKRKAEVYKHICDIIEILEANGVTPQPNSWDRE